MLMCSRLRLSGSKTPSSDCDTVAEEEAKAYKRGRQTRLGGDHQQWEGVNQAGGQSLTFDESSVFVLDPYWMIVLLATLVFVVRTCAANRKERDAIFRRKSSLKNEEADEDHSDRSYNYSHRDSFSSKGSSICISRENSELSFQGLLSSSMIAMAELDESEINSAETVVFRSPSPVQHLLSKRRKQ